MIIGIGVDIVKISRIKNKFANRILSRKETDVFDAFKFEARKTEYLAGRFALKEAIIKAIGRTKHKVGMRDLCILNDATGMPHLVFPEYEDIKIHISLSHEKDYCVGMCVIENV